MFSYCVVLFMGTALHSIHSHTFFYTMWAILGGLSAAKMVGIDADFIWIFKGIQVIRHLPRRQLLLLWYLWQQRVRVRVMLRFLVWGRLRIKIRIRVRIRVGVTFNIRVLNPLEQLWPEHILYIPTGVLVNDGKFCDCWPFDWFPADRILRLHCSVEKVDLKCTEYL